ncbi:ABC transporter substrate-binding protein [Nostoc sp. C057]|uniref:ABC transporter substrate-binding protein n=1 Tax=Nostoc sp. C057 TaxID=2576903 RepID=UPI0015C3DB23|nr:ABC transporter substrate-binding protein [Nostoc sp. C057]QLE49686.1 ABC transporter substrate-binding protein [Nostoc sp. C057]
MKYSTIFHIIKRFCLPIILASATAITVTACNPSNFKTAAAQVPQLVVSTTSDPKTFNYALIQESPNISGFTYEALATQNGITKEIEPALAESWEISPDKLRFVFTLREGLKWSDGKSLTADDVVFSFNDIYMNKRIPTYIQDALKIGSSKTFLKVRKVDERRVEFILPEPFAPFLRSIAAGVGILPEHALRAAVEAKNSDGKPVFMSTWGTDTDPKKIIVNGPYAIESYSTNQRLTFRRNPYYWRKKDAQGKQLPYIERVIWQIVESPDTALLQFRSGGLDLLEIGPGNFQLLKRQEKQGNFTIKNAGPDSGTSFITFNLNKGSRNGKPVVDPIKSRIFNNVAFRQAVAYAIDRQTMINNTLRGLGEPQDSPISVPSPYYFSPKEGLKTYDYNPEKAKQILLGAGFKYDDKGQLLDADGNRVRFTMMGVAGNRPTITPKIQQDLGKIGIKVDLQFLDFSIIGEKISNTLDWECWYGAITGGIEPQDGFNVWSVEGNFHVFNQKAQAGQSPTVGWKATDWEQKIEDLYIQGAREFDETKRKAIYAETQQLSQEYLPFIHLFNSLALVAVRNTIENVKYSAIGSYNWNIYELKVVEAKKTS